jgi:hypothetical protein
MTNRINLTTADEQACWEDYCEMLNLNASRSLRGLREEYEWANYWESVFEVLDPVHCANHLADQDAVAYGHK